MDSMSRAFNKALEYSHIKPAIAALHNAGHGDVSKGEEQHAGSQEGPSVQRTPLGVTRPEASVGSHAVRLIFSDMAGIQRCRYVGSMKTGPDFNPFSNQRKHMTSLTQLALIV